MDKIRIENLEVYAYHGLTPQEQEQGQKFTISAVLYADLRTAGKTDQFEQTIDHGAVCRFIAKFMRARTYRLLETVAERLAEEILLAFPKTEALDISITKQNGQLQAELPVGPISVSMHRGWHIVYLSFSSNYGDRRAYIDQGIVMLKEQKLCRVQQYSDVYESGFPEDLYYSGALRLRTLYTPWELRDVLRTLRSARDAYRMTAGRPGLWIWIFCFMMMKSFRAKTSACLILIWKTEIMCWRRCHRSPGLRDILRPEEACGRWRQG